VKKSIGLVLVNVALAFTLVGCKTKIESDNAQLLSIDEDAMALDSTMGQITESVEDLSQDSGAMQKITVSTCQQNGANGSLLNILYESQLIAGTNIKVDGPVERVYNNVSCSFTDQGDSFERSHELRFSSLYRDGSLSTSSSASINYLGQTIEGGEVLTKTANGFSLEVLGNNQKLTSGSGRKLFDISLITTSPLQFNGTFNRLNRNLVSGQIQIFHNLARYTATHTFLDLEWTESCKCPSSGLIEVDYAGLRTGGASIVINGCGSATLTTDQGAQRQLTLPRCQAE
jgi:hypothetical protein